MLANSEHTGTVVRWAAAFALGEIIKINTTFNKELLPAIDSILKREDQDSIKKVYQKALKEINVKNNSSCKNIWSSVYFDYSHG